MIGGNSGGYVEMGEFESLADFEKFMHRTFHEQARARKRDLQVISPTT
jgi:hypothetical protein